MLLSINSVHSTQSWLILTCWLQMDYVLTSGLLCSNIRAHKVQRASVLFVRASVLCASVRICSDRHSEEQVETSHLSLQDAHWPRSNTQRLIPARVVSGRAPCETGTPATCSHQEKLFMSALRGHFALLNHAQPDTLTLLWSIPHPVSGGARIKLLTMMHDINKGFPRLPNFVDGNMHLIFR